MKKHLAVFILLLCPLLMMAQGKDKQDKLMSGGVIYHTDTKNFGVNFQAMFPIGGNVYIAPDLAYFFPKEDRETYYYDVELSEDEHSSSRKATFQVLNLNADFHYPLYVGKKSFISPLLGFGGYIGFMKEKWSGSSESYNSSGSLFHANIGIAGKFAVTDKIFISHKQNIYAHFKKGLAYLVLLEELDSTSKI